MVFETGGHSKISLLGSFSLDYFKILMVRSPATYSFEILEGEINFIKRFQLAVCCMAEMYDAATRIAWAELYFTVLSPQCCPIYMV